LVSEGLAERTPEQRETPGRPRTLYRATNDGVRTGRRSYGLLAEILTRYLATHVRRPTREALRAGEEWGRLLTTNARSTGDAAAATRHLVRTLDEIGFAPEAVRVGGERQIRLHHCPFWEAAEQNREVVCAVHLGLMRGVLAELDAPIDADRLDPWVGPSLCVTHLGVRAQPAQDPPSG
jgi:predicted ArsR family transcriptional regulator